MGNLNRPTRMIDGTAWYEVKEGQYQRAPYIEDGAYIKKTAENKFEVWVIAQYGGGEELYETFGTLDEAYVYTIRSSDFS